MDAFSSVIRVALFKKRQLTLCYHFGAIWRAIIGGHCILVHGFRNLAPHSQGASLLSLVDVTSKTPFIETSIGVDNQLDGWRRWPPARGVRFKGLWLDNATSLKNTHEFS